MAQRHDEHATGGSQAGKGRSSCNRSGVPDNIWLGVSVEDNRVKGRIDTLRQLKDVVGGFTAFLSVEPLIGPCDQHDSRDIDQVLIGGESGGGARECRLILPAAPVTWR